MNGFNTNKIVGKENLYGKTKHSDRVAVCILSLYMLFLWTAYMFQNTEEVDIICVGAILFSFIFFLLLSKKIIKIVSGINITRKRELSREQKIMTFVSVTLASIIVLGIWFVAYFPGAFSSDSFNQYIQVINGKYNDWHPVLHTLISFTIPLKISNNIWIIVVFQIIAFSLVMGYSGMVLNKYLSGMTTFACVGYILLNPQTGAILMYPWKDVSFAIWGCLAMTLSADIFLSNKKQERQGVVLIFMGIILAVLTIVRHNGILFSIPLLFALLFCVGKRQRMQLVLIFLGVLFLVKVPLYNILDVESPKSRVVETMGLPLTVIGNVAKEAPEKMDEETASFVYSLASSEKWKEEYICGNYNSIKWKVDNAEVIEKTGRKKILEIMFHCFKKAPSESFRALFSLTDIVYAVDGEIKGNIEPCIIQNELGITYSGNRFLADRISNCRLILNGCILKYINYIGVSIFIIVCTILGKMEWDSSWALKRILLCLPILAYDFGTMLLLSGPDLRFFYISYLVCPIVIIIMFHEKGAESNV